MSSTPDAQFERGFGGLNTNKSLKFLARVQAQRTLQGQTSTIKGNPAALLVGLQGLQPVSRIVTNNSAYKVFCLSRLALAPPPLSAGGKGKEYQSREKEKRRSSGGGASSVAASLHPLTGLLTPQDTNT